MIELSSVNYVKNSSNSMGKLTRRRVRRTRRGVSRGVSRGVRGGSDYEGQLTLREDNEKSSDSL